MVRKHRSVEGVLTSKSKAFLINTGGLKQSDRWYWWDRWCSWHSAQLFLYEDIKLKTNCTWGRRSPQPVLTVTCEDRKPREERALCSLEETSKQEVGMRAFEAAKTKRSHTLKRDRSAGEYVSFILWAFAWLPCFQSKGKKSYWKADITTRILLAHTHRTR